MITSGNTNRQIKLMKRQFIYLFIFVPVFNKKSFGVFFILQQEKASTASLFCLLLLPADAKISVHAAAVASVLAEEVCVCVGVCAIGVGQCTCTMSPSQHLEFRCMVGKRVL